MSNSNDRGYPVDPNVQLAIEKGNKSVIKEITKVIEKSNKDIKEYIKDYTHPVKEDVKRLRSNVDDLYQKDIEMRDRVSKLEQRQALDEGQHQGAAGASENTWKAKNYILAIIGTLIGIAGFLFGILK